MVGDRIATRLKWNGGTLGLQNGACQVGFLYMAYMSGVHIWKRKSSIIPHPRPPGLWWSTELPP